MKKDKLKAFSLIEMTMFIAILGIILVGLTSAFTNTLKNTPKADIIFQATELAQERMEFITNQRRLNGFASTVDPCPGPAICTPPAGYSITPTISANWGGDTNYKVVTVVVDAPENISITLTSLVADF